MNTWIIAASTAEIANITDAAGKDAKLLVCGNADFAAKFAHAPVSQIYHFDPGENPAELYAQDIAAFLVQEEAEILLAANFAAERALTASAAAKIGAVWISGAVSWDPATRRAVRNIAALSLETIRINTPAALIFAATGELTEGAPEIKQLRFEKLSSVEILAQTPITANNTDLSKAARVIGVGRGIAKKEDLALVSALATQIDAQIGATRPLAEGYGWFDSYIGLTGQPVAADLYLAIGTSGQIHHAGGVRESNIIAAICDDPQAPIFQEADYGIVGDLYEILPQIQAAL